MDWPCCVSSTLPPSSAARFDDHLARAIDSTMPRPPRRRPAGDQRGGDAMSLAIWLAVFACALFCRQLAGEPPVPEASLIARHMTFAPSDSPARPTARRVVRRTTAEPWRGDGLQPATPAPITTPGRALTVRRSVIIIVSTI